MSPFDKKSVSKNKKIDRETPRKNEKKGKSLLKKLIGITTLVVVVALIFSFVKYKDFISEKIHTQFLRQPLEKIEFHSDGVLTNQWAKSFLSFPKGVDILEVDIFKIQQEMERCSQVKSVTITRVFPATIHVEIEERKPILRVMVRDKKMNREMFIDEEGVVFSGENFSEIDRRMMPFLAGTTLKKEKDHYKKVPLLEKVRELLFLAKTKYWPIYAQMEVVTIESLQKKSVPWSRIKVRCQCAPVVIFKDTDFDEQLKRLDFILNTPKVRANIPVERIDLTYPKDAVVRFRK